MSGAAREPAMMTWRQQEGGKGSGWAGGQVGGVSGGLRQGWGLCGGQWVDAGMRKHKLVGEMRCQRHADATVCNAPQTSHAIHSLACDKVPAPPTSCYDMPAPPTSDPVSAGLH